MPLLISLLYLLLNIAIVVLCAALIYWALKVFGIPMDPWVMKILQFILALIVIILIVSWFAGVLPQRGIFGRLGDTPGKSSTSHQIFA
jgi:energy-coupling factor transporter transmembrane protein EcfT